MPTGSADPARRVFLDTNVVLYLLSADERKANVAEALLARGGVVSVQVLNEAASVCLRKLKLPWSEVRELLDAVKACCEVLRSRSPSMNVRSISRSGIGYPFTTR